MADRRKKMDWMAQLEAGIREALTKVPVSDYWVVVHEKAQASWGRQRARDIILKSDTFDNAYTLNGLEFRVISDREERERWPVGSLIHFFKNHQVMVLIFYLNLF